METSIKILPLGGLGEVGKNMMVIESPDDIVIVDCGVMFPKPEMLGVDLVIPDIAYLQQRKEKVKAFLITHGHEDHLGALPLILPKINVPVFAPPIAYDLAKVKLEEFGILAKSQINEIQPGEIFELGSFSIEFFRVCHSIPDACGIAIKTPIGLVVHTGDFKVDHTPIDGNRFNLMRIAEMGNQGVLLLMSDSTYAEVPGYTPSEQVVSQALKHVISDAPGRVIIATFASLISRVQQIIDAAIADGRTVSVAGRSMTNNVKMAFQKGYLKAPQGTMTEISLLGKIPESEQVIIVTGAQGEPTSVLNRIAYGRHKDISLLPNDTIVLSASTIPGNETVVARTIDQLVKKVSRVITPRQAQVHVRGHGSQEELKLILNLTQPEYFVPIHGEYRMLAAHADLAISMGVSKEKVFILEDGDLLEISKDKAKIIDTVPADHVFVDGLDWLEFDNIVLGERRKLSRNGFVLVAIPFNSQKGEFFGEPKITTAGLVDQDKLEDLQNSTSNYLSSELKRNSGMFVEKMEAIRLIKKLVSSFIYEHTGRRPMVIPVPVEVDQNEAN